MSASAAGDQASRAIRMLVLACAMWGLSFPAAKALGMVQSRELPDAGTWFFSVATNLARFALAALITFALVCVKRRGIAMTALELRQGLGLGFFAGMGMLLQMDGLYHTHASTSAFLTQGTVFFIPVFKMLWLRRLPAAREAACCLLAVAGVAILSGIDVGRFAMGRGEVETLAAAVMFTGQILWIERDEFRANNALKVSVVMFASIAALCLPASLLVGADLGGMKTAFAHATSWGFLAILIVPCTLLAFLWMNHWQPHVPATSAGLVYCLEPVFASLFALILPGWFSLLAGIDYRNESLTRQLLAGGGLILLANILMQWPPADRGQPRSLYNEHGV